MSDYRMSEERQDYYLYARDAKRMLRDALRVSVRFSFLPPFFQIPVRNITHSLLGYVRTSIASMTPDRDCRDGDVRSCLPSPRIRPHESESLGPLEVDFVSYKLLKAARRPNVLPRPREARNRIAHGKSLFRNSCIYFVRVTTGLLGLEQRKENRGRVHFCQGGAYAARD